MCVWGIKYFCKVAALEVEGAVFSYGSKKVLDVVRILEKEKQFQIPSNLFVREIIPRSSLVSQ